MRTPKHRALLLLLPLVVLLAVAWYVMWHTTWSPAARARAAFGGAEAYAVAFDTAKGRELLAAVKAGDYDAAESLLKAGANPNHTSEYGIMPLHEAARNGDVKLARLLLDHGAAVDAVADSEKLTPLCYASKERATEVVELLLDRGAEPNFEGDYDTIPIIEAARHGDARMVRLLLDHGAEVNARTTCMRDCALTWAAWRADSELASLLLDAGAKSLGFMDGYYSHAPTSFTAAAMTHDEAVFQTFMDHGWDVQGKDGLHALFVAAERGDADAVRWLVEHGVDPTTEWEDGETALHNAGSPEVVEYLLSRGGDASAKTTEGWTPLHHTPRVRYTGPGGKRCAELLIAHGADVNAATDDGSTPLHCACWRKRGDMEVARVLLRHGANPNARDAEGTTALHLIATRHWDSAEDVDLLLRYGADVNARDNRGNTPLHLSETAEVCRCLLEHGADVSAVTLGGHTPLHVICGAHRPHARQVALLLQYGADPRRTSNDGWTPLHRLASREEFLDDAQRAARLLVEHGADVNAKDSWRGATPLHYARTKEMARILLDLDADPHARNDKGETPGDSALRKGLDDVAAVIRQARARAVKGD